jgi:hypothetical protein
LGSKSVPITTGPLEAGFSFLKGVLAVIGLDVFTSVIAAEVSGVLKLKPPGAGSSGVANHAPSPVNPLAVGSTSTGVSTAAFLTVSSSPTGAGAAGAGLGGKAAGTGGEVCGPPGRSAAGVEGGKGSSLTICGTRSSNPAPSWDHKDHCPTMPIPRQSTTQARRMWL